MKSWLNENLSEWIESSPEWFKAHAKASIPDDLVSDSNALNEICGEEVVVLKTSSRVFPMSSSVGVISGRESVGKMTWDMDAVSGRASIGKMSSSIVIVSSSRESYADDGDGPELRRRRSMVRQTRLALEG